MAEVVGVRFRKAGKIYFFDPSGIALKPGDYVVVTTGRGQETGQVAVAPSQIVLEETDEPLKQVVRKAEPEDIARVKELEVKAKEALVECGKLVGELQLPMKLLTAEYNLEGNRVTFLFSAEDRVDFRELVRQLNNRLKVRVELRQVGSRDEAKLVGGYGRCGRHLCCAAFLDEFAPVSIRMAKEQDLPLNPMKISGICGRLMCCLGYENEQYRAAKQKVPRNGTRVHTKSGDATVVGSNPLKETVMVELDSEATVELPLTEITISPPVQGDVARPAARVNPRPGHLNSEEKKQ
ncbi:MAG: stage 0 sporulation family protein [Dehalococcoidales bacterium]|nr:stage 0 sporulation family protein [Dehalococcoidales bacterium]